MNIFLAALVVAGIFVGVVLLWLLFAAVLAFPLSLVLGFLWNEIIAPAFSQQPVDGVTAWGVTLAIILVGGLFGKASSSK